MGKYNRNTINVDNLLINSSTYWYDQRNHTGFYPLSSITPCSSNGWEQYDYLKNYGFNGPTDENNKFIKQGYVPTFVGENTTSGSGAWFETGANDTYNLTVASDGSKISVYANYTGITTSFVASRFRDGVLPKRMIVVLQGAGGRGGWTFWNQSSQQWRNAGGGGSGAFCAVVLRTEPGDSYKIQVGEGGKANDSGNSWLKTSDGTLLITAGRGSGGSTSQAGGAGGAYTLHSGEGVYWWHLPSKRVGPDGTITYDDSCYNGIAGGDPGKSGGNRGTVTTYTSFSTDIKWQSKTWTFWNFGGTSAGSKGFATGGGAASFFGNGGNGGTINGGRQTPGSPGGYGAGGGGGGNGQQSGGTAGGGRGGNGWFALYY